MAYLPPVRNPLRRLPIRQYQGPFQNRLPGLGQAPIDIGTSAVVDVTPTTTTITTPQGVSTVPTTNATGGFTDWLNQNSSTVLWIAGIAVAVMVFSRLTK